LKPIFDTLQQDFGNNIVVTVIDIDELTDELKGFVDNNLVAVCEGSGSNSSVEEVKEIVQELFKNKENKKDKDKYSNWEMGAVAEFFAHLYLTSIGLKQEFMFLNVEERSVKKGFDGYYTDNADQWVMESKSGSIETEGISHNSKLNEAIDDLGKKISGKVKNNPWRNAYNHAQLIDVKSAEDVRDYLKQMSKDFRKKEFKLEEFNIIPCATIYYENTEFSKKEDVAAAVSDVIKPGEKKVHLVCVSSRSVGVFKNYMGIK